MNIGKIVGIALFDFIFSARLRCRSGHGNEGYGGYEG